METATTAPQAKTLLTLGDVARQLGQPQHRVKHAITAYDIEPRQRAGILRLWSADQVPLIIAAMKRCAERRTCHV